MAREAGTEAIQTGIEQYGAAKPLDVREIVDSAGIGAVAITAGASASAGTAGASAAVSGGKRDARTTGEFYRGFAVFTIAKGGLMYEAAVAGQKFSFTPKASASKN